MQAQEEHVAKNREQNEHEEQEHRAGRLRFISLTAHVLLHGLDQRKTEKAGQLKLPNSRRINKPRLPARQKGKQVSRTPRIDSLTLLVEHHCKHRRKEHDRVVVVEKNEYLQGERRVGRDRLR